MKEKIIEWLDIDSPPLLIKDSTFVEADKNVNKITVIVGQEHNGKVMQLLIGKNQLNSSAKYYENTITNSRAEFLLETSELFRGVYKIFIRIVEEVKTLAACTMKYQIECGNNFTKIIPPEILATEADVLIKELKDKIVKADDIKIRLEGVVRAADTTKTNLQHVIDIAVTEGDNLTAKTVIANTACANLDSEVVEANNSKKALETEIAKVPGEIKKLQDESNAQQGLIRGEGTKQVKLVTDTGTLEVNKVTAEGNTQTNRVTVEGDSQFNRVNTEGIGKVNDIVAEGTKQLGLITAEGVKQLDTVATKGTEIIAAGNAKIEEIKALPNGVGVNIKNDKQYRTWLGTVKEFSMIQKKARDVLYHVFDDNFNMVKSHFEELAPVKNGLICWLDGRDGKGTETTWVDRSWDMNSATLTGFSFTQGSGWTGKSLKFDRVKAAGVLDNQNIGWKTLEVDFECYSYAYSLIASYGLEWSNNCLEVLVKENQLVVQGGNFNKILEVDNTVKNTLQITNDGNILKIYVNGKHVTDVAGVTLYETSRLNLGINTNRDTYGEPYMNAVRLYSRVLNDSEIFTNYEYDKSIDRTIPVVYPLTGEIESYGIGLSNQLSEEQLKTFRLNNDKTKFVAGLNYCEGLIVDKYTYSKTLEIMETKDWKSEESYIS